LNEISDNPQAIHHRRIHWRWWQWLGIVVVAIAIAFGVGVWLLLRSGTIHRYLLERARQQASAALGGMVQIGDFDLHLSGLSPSIDVFNVVVPGAPLPQAQGHPLLRIPHIHVGVEITSVLERAWHVNDLEVDRPVVWFVQAADGKTNLPKLKSGSGSGPDVFDLGIRHAVVRQGEVYINSRPSQLEADLRQVRFDVHFDPGTRHYTGQFGYQDGQLQFQNLRPISHSLAMNFSAAPSGLAISSLVLTSGHSRLTAAATVAPYAHPVVRAQYQLALDAAQARTVLRNPALPAGTLAVVGTVSYDSAAATPWEGLQAAGNFSSRALTVTVAGLGTPVEGLAGRFQLGHGTLEVTPISARVAGGALTASLRIRGLGHTAAAQLSARLAGGHLEQVARFAGAGAATLGQAGVSGQIDTTAAVRWTGALDGLTADFNASLKAAIAARQPTQAAIPVTGSVQAQYQGGRLMLTAAHLDAPQESVSAQGTITTTAAGSAAIQVQWQSGNLAETEAIADRVGAGLSGSVLPALNLAGTATFTGTVGGALSAPRIGGHLTLTNLRARGTAWRRVSADLAASPVQASVANAVLLPVGAGHVALSATAGLTSWSYKGSNPLTFSVQVTQLPMRQLAPLLDPVLGQPVPLAGSFSLHAEMHGSADNPLGQGSFQMAPARLTVGSVNQPLRSLQVDFHGGGSGSGAAITAAMQAVLPAGRITADGTYYPRQSRYQVQLHAPAIELSQLQVIERRQIPVRGAMSITGTGTGTVADPEFDLTAAAAKLEVQGQAVTGLSLNAHLADHAVHAVLASSAVDTNIHGEATIALRDNWPATIQLDTQTISLATALAAFAPGMASGISGHTEVHASLSGPLRQMDYLQAHVTLPVLNFDYDNRVHLAVAAPVHVDLSGGIATLQPVTITGTDTHLQVGGTIPVTGAAPMRITAVGTVDLGLIHAFAPDLTTSGEAQLNLNASGPIANPQAAGEIQIVRAGIVNPSWPVGVQNANGVLRLDGNRLTISSFNARVGGGTLTASGGVVLHPALQFDLGIRADQVRLLYPPTVRETLGATLSLTGSPAAATLSGRVRLQDVSVTPQFDFTQVLGQFSGATTVTAPGSFLQDLALNIAVTTPNEIRAVSRDFSLQASVNVTVRGSAAEPAVLGRVNINSGDLIFRGDRYVLSSGTLDFVNPNQIQPVVNISADTRIQQYSLHLHFQGQASNLRTSYTSDPALPPADIINLLAFGTTTEASAANPSPGNLGAENLIASAVSSQITDRVQKIAGISQLSVDPVLRGGQQGGGARITVQQRVTANLFVTISTDVTSTQRDVIEIQYQISPRVSVSAVRDQNGGVGLNTSFKRSW
jgi:translocation and assembly module TamB